MFSKKVVLYTICSLLSFGQCALRNESFKSLLTDGILQNVNAFVNNEQLLHTGHGSLLSGLDWLQNSITSIRNAIGNRFAESYASYTSRRDQFKTDDKNLLYGHLIPLTANEKKVSDFLLSLAVQEYDAGYKDSKTFLASQSMTTAGIKSKIDQSSVFKLLKNLPKGANLNGYLPLLVTSDYLYQLTMKDNLYIRIISATSFELLYASTVPAAPAGQTAKWQLLKDVRNGLSGSKKSADNFEQWIKNALTFNPAETDEYHARWVQVREFLKVSGPLLNFRGNFADHFKWVLQSFYDDTVRYVELASDFPEVYELTGTKHAKLEVAKYYATALAEFKAKNWDFFGAKLIYTPARGSLVTGYAQYQKDVTDLTTQFPNLVLGIDFFGEPDLGAPLSIVADKLIQYPVEVKFYLTVGETVWWGLQSDDDLYDALALKTVRLRNPYSITKHPRVMQTCKDSGLAIEMMPLSNLGMGMVKNVLNHPFATLVAQDYPLVIVNDVGGLWNSVGLSYEYYYAYMGLTPRLADLSVLKEFALNSYIYSSLSAGDKILVLKIWAQQWTSFINDVIKTNKL